MINAIVNRPNRVVEKQKQHQSAHGPIWLRSRGAKPFMTVYYAGFTLTMVGTVYGMYSLIKGKPSA